MAKESVRKKGKKWYYRFYVEDASGNHRLPSYAISFWYCSNDSGLTLPFSVSVSSANKSISSFLCRITTYCIRNS